MSRSRPLLIRRAVASDADAVAEVFLAARSAMTFLPRLHSKAATRMFIRRLVASVETWLALRSNRVAGFASLDGDWLTHLYVDPARQHTGIGSALIEHVKSLRPDGFQLWTFQANGGARRFYERHGCVAVDETDGQRNEEKLPDVLYVWPQDRAPQA